MCEGEYSLNAIQLHEFTEIKRTTRALPGIYWLLAANLIVSVLQLVIAAIELR